jgi:hypothetical protein
MPTQKKASEVSGKSSYSLFKRRKRENQANVRSTTQRFCWTTKPFCPAGGTTPVKSVQNRHNECFTVIATIYPNS